ncbi:MAG: P-loop NTPase fold protein [Sphingomonas sp.]
MSAPTMEAPPESATRSAAEADLIAAVRAAFAPHAHPKATAFTRCIDHMSAFLVVDVRANELVIDKRALLCGIIAAGNDTAAQGRGLNSATWLRQWIETEGGSPPLPKETPLIEALGLREKGASIVLSESVRVRVFPRAHALAEATVRRELFDLRHLLFALAEEADSIWREVLKGGLSPDESLALRRYLVERILSGPEPGEDVAAWRRLVGEDAPPPPPPENAESLRTLSDQPATTDALGRQFFAKVLASRLREAQASDAASGDAAGAFMTHIHGPWGSGKSSVLNFLRQELESGGKPWLVVDFNAWKHNRIRPPWWSLISAVYETALKSPEIRNNGRLRRIWWGWRLRADWGPVALVVVLIAIGAAGALSSADATVKLVSGLITAGAAIFAGTRVLSFGSAKAAAAYAELKTDPYRPVIRLYCQLVEAIGRPVAIFVDDLDRCEGSYVVELIEGIQTLLRTEPVTYVIAAERKWICSAFEKRYADFSAPIGEPARPLGYLFLDKLFQISAALPGLSPEMRKGYWAGLLDAKRTAPDAPRLSEREAAQQVEGKGSIEALNQVIAAAPEAQKPQLRAAAALEISHSRSADAIEHSLQPFADLLEPNPRAMKRLVNAVGMAQARAFLEARDVSLDTLARWTLLELRWPLLADHIAGDIEAIDCARDPAGASTLPPSIAALATDRNVRAVVAPKDQPGLDAALLGKLLG